MTIPSLRHSAIPLLAAFSACQPTLPPHETWLGYASIADGRAIPFVLDLDTRSSPPTADFVVGDERTPVPEVVLRGDSVLLIVSEYQAAFRLVWDGRRLAGRYERYRADTTGYAVSAIPGIKPAVSAVPSPAIPLVGTFTVHRPTSSGIDSSSTAVFWSRGDSVFGTIVAPSGDDGLMAGTQEGDTVRIGRFTGWQSIYLELVREGAGWSGLRFIRELVPSPIHLRQLLQTEDRSSTDPVTRPRAGLRQFAFTGVTPEGDTLKHTDERFVNKSLIIDIMGTWCHNCLDSAPLLQQIYEEYTPRGLEVVSLAFELRDDVRLGRRNLGIFRDRHRLTYPMIYCGDISPENVSERLGSQLEHFGAYPTAIFIDRTGRIVDIHKGFRGPGTGEGFQREIEHFYQMAERLTQ